MASHPALRIWGPLGRADLPGLYARACLHIRGAAGGDLHVDVGGVPPDAVALDAIARLGLAARRHGCRVVLVGAADALWRLIDLSGLGEVFLSPGAEEDRTGGTASRSPGRR